MASEEDTSEVSIEEEEAATAEVPSPLRIERGTVVAAVERLTPSFILSYNRQERESSQASTATSQPAVVSPQAVRATTMASFFETDPNKVRSAEALQQYLESPSAEALQQYLESPGATIRHLELQELEFSRVSGNSKILDGLGRNSSVKELTFKGCLIGRRCFYVRHNDGSRRWLSEEQVQSEQQEHAQQFAALIQNDMPNLETLRFSGDGNFLDYPVVVDALCQLLVRRTLSLRCLDLEIVDCISSEGTFQATVPLDAFQMVLTAASKSTLLERILIRSVPIDEDDEDDGYFDCLENAIPSLKVKGLSVTALDGLQVENKEPRLLEALKNNYVAQSIKVLRRTWRRNNRTHFLTDGNDDDPWFSDGSQARLDAILDRNQKLAQWVSNPKLVPCELWSYAVNLALKAGINSLFESLVALSGQGVGLPTDQKQADQKREAHPKHHHHSDSVAQSKKY